MSQIVDTESAKALASGLKNCNSLEECKLDSNDIGDDGIEAIMAGLHCRNLSTLGFSNNDISAKGILL